MSVSLIKWSEDGPSRSSKYDSLRDEYLHDLGPDYWDEYDGSVEAPTGWFALMINAPETADDLASAGAIFDLSPVKEIVGNFLLSGDDRGFGYVQAFDTEGEARSAYAELELAYGEWLEANDDEDVNHG